MNNRVEKLKVVKKIAQKPIPILIGIKTPLSSKPKYIKVPSPSISIDAAISNAVQKLREMGNEIEANQLENLYKSHTIIAHDREVSKGELLSSLPKTTKIVGGTEYEYIEILMTERHAGGNV